ncbi:UNVERIFIED_CONTAM: hypothetical protein K2H54_006073 [Gekko kuhli]
MLGGLRANGEGSTPRGAPCSFLHPSGEKTKATDNFASNPRQEREHAPKLKSVAKVRIILPLPRQYYMVLIYVKSVFSKSSNCKSNHCGTICEPVLQCFLFLFQMSEQQNRRF